MEQRRSSKRFFRPGLTTIEHLTGDFTTRLLSHPPFRKPLHPTSKGSSDSPASAPIWAGFSSVVDSALGFVGHGRVGFLNPFLYQLIFNQDNGLLINQIFDVNDIIDVPNGNALLLVIPAFFTAPAYDTST